MGRNRLFSVRSLQAKIVATIIPLVLISTGSLFAINQISVLNKAIDDLQVKLEEVASIQSASLAQPLWNVDEKQVLNILNAMITDREIIGAEVLDEAEKSIAKVGTFNAERETVSQIERPIVFSSETIGKLRVAITDRLVWAAAIDRMEVAGMAAMMLIVSIVVGIMLVYRRTIGKPLRLLMQSILISREHGTRQPLDWHSNDEMGAVVSAFNEMQERHETDQKALISARDTLEERVDQRTRQLSTARQRLTDAIESTSEGFAFYDAEDNLVICNSRYAKLLYPDQDVAIEPGMAFDQIIRQSAAAGHISEATDNTEEWIAQRIERHRNPGEPQLQKRVGDQWILISERKTSDNGTVAIYSDISNLKQREQELSNKSNALEQLSAQLAKYLSPQVYDSIFSGKQEVKIVSKRKRLTVFFADLVGFTETTERLESEDLTRLLNQYLTEMSQIAIEYGATIDKYIGDAIVIFFGDPDTRGIKDDAVACVNMALAMRKRILELQVVWKDAGVERPLQCRMGISTGMCTVGNFGSESRMDYTIIGSGVNLAARMEEASQPNEILISYETFAHVKDVILCEENEAISVKGVSYPVTTYRVMDRIDRLADGEQSLKTSLPHFQLEADVAQMSQVDRDKALVAVNDLLDKLSP